MSTRRCFFSFLLSILSICFVTEASLVHEGAKALHVQAKKASDGVAHLSKEAFFRLVATKEKRPYHVFVYLTAEAHSSSQVKEYRDNFGHVSRSYFKEHHGGEHQYDVFFVDLEYAESPELFHMLKVRQIPFAFHIRPDFKVKSYTEFAVDSKDMIPTGALAGGAQALADYVRESSGVAISEVVIPKFYQNPLFVPVAIILVLLVLLTLRTLMVSGILYNKYLYLVGALVVFWLSVSGIMFDIIRGVPFNGYNHQTGRVQWFTRQTSYQYVAEGLIMGAFYTIAGLSLCLITMVAPKMKDPSWRRVFTYIGLLGFYWSFKYTAAVYTWKTGHSSRSFYPSWLGILNIF